VKETVVVLHQSMTDEAGPDELDVLDQAAAIGSELRRMGYRVHSLPFDLDLKTLTQRIHKHRPRCVFNLVETVMGDGRLSHVACTYLDIIGVPYTGSGPDAMYLTSNKVLAKSLMRAWGIPTPEWYVPGTPRGCPLDFPCTWIVKPVWEDASVGIDEGCVVKASSIEELAGHVLLRERTLERPCFAERFVDGREFNVALLASPGGPPEILPVSEIAFSLGEGEPRIVGYRAKWVEDSPEYTGTVRVLDFPEDDSALLSLLKDTARACWDRFGLRGYARVDFRVDPDNAPRVLEVNANPCIAPDSGFCASARRAGIPLGDLVGRILNDAVGHLPP